MADKIQQTMHRSEIFVKIIGLITDNKRWRHL